MEIGHGADFHFGISEESDEVSFACLTEYFVEAHRRKVRVKVIAGDIFEHAIVNTAGNPLPRLINILLSFQDIPTIILRGTPTHDIEGSLDVLGVLPNVTVVDRWQILELGSEAVLYCMPEPSKASLAASGVEVELFDSAFNEAVKKALMAFKAQDILSKYPPELPRILIAHGKFSGAKNFFGREFTGPTSGLEAKELSGADAVLLGDIHQRQFLDEDKTIAYCGSPTALYFGEPEKDKGVIFWDFEGRKATAEVFPLENARRVDTIEITEILESGSLIYTINGEVIPAGKFDNYPFTNSDVKIKAPASLSKEGAIGRKYFEEVKTFFEKASRSVKIDWLSETQEASIRSEKITKTSNLPEDVEEYERTQGREATDSLLNKAKEVEANVSASAG